MPAVESTRAGGVYLNAKQLEGVATTLEAGFKVKAATMRVAAAAAAATATAATATAGDSYDASHDEALLYPQLALLSQGISERELATVRALRSCIHVGCSAGSVLSAVSRVSSLWSYCCVWGESQEGVQGWLVDCSIDCWGRCAAAQCAAA